MPESHYSMDTDNRPIGKRRTGRRRQECLLSSCEPIIDISRGGAKILVTLSYKGERMIKMISNAGFIDIRVRFAWFQRIGFRRVLIGVEFLDLDAESAAFLAHIATAHASSARQAA